MPRRRAIALRVESPAFTLKPGLVLIGDYTAVNQDAASLAQVGPQDDRWEIRAAHLMLRGSIGRDFKVGYLTAGEYNGNDPTGVTDALLLRMQWVY